MPADVRNGSKADICSAPTHVRFTPESGLAGANRNVHFGPIADIDHLYSMTSSAAKRKPFGIVTPSALAILRSTSAAPRGLDRGDVNLLHSHHRIKRALCFIAAGRQRFGQYTRRDLPRHAPLVFAPAARAFLAAIIHDRVPIAIRLSLIVSGDLERKGFIVFERWTTVEADTGDASNFELDRQHISLLARWIVTGRTVDGTDRTVGKDIGIKSSSGLGILIVPEANCVLCHCMSFRLVHA